MSAIPARRGNDADSAPVDVTDRASALAFPYVGLDEAMKVANAIYSEYGTRCDLDQLAAALSTTIKSSRFRSMVSAAKMFGLIDRRSKVAVLTDLGVAVVDPEKRDDAKAQAFLAVPLYRAIHDKFAGRLLPPGPGLEAELQAFGVTTRSVSKARQTLQRSAETAGFFRSGKDRLVRPPASQGDDPPLQDEAPRPLQTDPRAPRPTAGPNDPILQAIWSGLPLDGDFPDPERSEWLAMLKLALNRFYGRAPEHPEGQEMRSSTSPGERFEDRNDKPRRTVNDEPL